MSINTLSDEEILKLIFINNNQFYTKENIQECLKEYHSKYNLSLEKINSCLNTLEHSNIFLNVDQFYEKNLDIKEKRKMIPREIIRYIARNTKKDSEYGNFHKIEYMYIRSIILNELIKMHASNNLIKECLDYLDTHELDFYDSDRYIIPYSKFNNKYNYNDKFIYNKHIYKIKNIYVVFSQENMYFCTRTLCQKNGKVILYGNINNDEYYHNKIYDYYNIENNEFVCSSNYDFQIISLYDIYNISYSNKKDDIINLEELKESINFLSNNDDSKVKEYIFSKM